MTVQRRNVLPAYTYCKIKKKKRKYNFDAVNQKKKKHVRTQGSGDSTLSEMFFSITTASNQDHRGHEKREKL